MWTPDEPTEGVPSDLNTTRSEGEAIRAEENAESCFGFCRVWFGSAVCCCRSTSVSYGRVRIDLMVWLGLPVEVSVETVVALRRIPYLHSKIKEIWGVVVVVVDGG